ncbi:MAG: IS481 family transposase ISChy3 [Candidatus Omnitrophica bacterium]|nr:IS481 family transposase ISChy3 [Candidatus Omnitrophota bacterium]
MYEPFYGLKEKPFGVTSNPSYLYLSQRHQEALSCLLYGIRERLGFIEMTGEVGTGKTTVCRALLDQLDTRTRSAFIFNSNLSELQLLQTIVDDLGIRTTSRSKGALYAELNRFLIEQLAAGNNVVVIIDEAQNLSLKLLEQVRMLSNLEAANEKLVQIVLVGQPELRDKLNDPRLRQLRQRIAVRYQIKPLEREELPRYVGHRLSLAGSNGSGPIFTDAALDSVYRYTSGIPRMINLVCDKALLTGYVMDQREIGPELVVRAISELEGLTDESRA